MRAYFRVVLKVFSTIVGLLVITMGIVRLAYIGEFNYNGVTKSVSLM